MDTTATAAAASAGRRRAWRPDRYLTANLLLWLLTYALITLRATGVGTTPMPHQGEMAVRRLFVCLAGVVLCMLIRRVLAAARDWRMNPRLGLAAGLSVAGAAGWAGVNHLAFYVIRPLAEWTSPPHELFIGALMNGSVIVWTFIAWCAVVIAIDYDQAVRERDLRLAQAQALAAESQNRMLRYQINPHFLFNTLNALSSLILQKDHDRAEQVVLSLSGFLRASLEKDPSEKTTLAGELEAQRQYLAIEQIRFGDRLQLEIDAPGDVGSALVPSLILQPLVENAVKHGVARSSAPVRLCIRAEAAAKRLKITVEDDAEADIAEEPVRLGVGLENVRERLALLYGEAGRLDCGRRAGGGFTCTVELPLERR